MLDSYDTGPSSRAWSVFMKRPTEELTDETKQLFQAVLSLPAHFNNKKALAAAAVRIDGLLAAGADREAGFQQEALGLGHNGPLDIPQGATPWQVLIEHVLPQAPNEKTEQKLELIGDMILSRKDEAHIAELQRRERAVAEQEPAGHGAAHLHPEAMSELPVRELASYIGSRPLDRPKGVMFARMDDHYNRGSLDDKIYKRPVFIPGSQNSPEFEDQEEHHNGTDEMAANGSSPESWGAAVGPRPPRGARHQVKRRR
jgi:hypothetical protein